MNDGLRTERLALPLPEAAVRLGISAEALRLRLERGEARGFDRDGTSFVYVNDFAAERRFGGAAAEPPPDRAPEPSLNHADAMPPDGTLPVVVEFQKLELSRLLRENERLNTRLDQLFDEIRHLRDMQQREQVLRQQDQTLRRQIQETLDRLTTRPSLPPPGPAMGAAGVSPSPKPPSPKPPSADPPQAGPPPSRPVESRSELVLTRTAAAKIRDQGPATPTRRPGPAFLATGRKPTGPGRREPHAAMPTPGPGTPAARGLSATLAPAAASSAVDDGAIRPEEAAELAGILNDIGQSLRDSEAFRRYPPIKPGSTPQRAGDRRPANPLPGGATAPVRATGAATKPRSAAKILSAAKTLSAEESALLAILDSMGPTAEDRRNAVRDLRRLLRNGLPSRAGEP